MPPGPGACIRSAQSAPRSSATFSRRPNATNPRANASGCRSPNRSQTLLEYLKATPEIEAGDDRGQLPAAQGNGRRHRHPGHLRQKRGPDRPFRRLSRGGKDTGERHDARRVRLKSGLQVDLRVVPARSYGAALVYFTGSKAHNIALRALAMKRGLKFNEYGVFKAARWLAGETEKDVYAKAGLPYIAPELRENSGANSKPRIMIRFPGL